MRIYINLKFGDLVLSADYSRNIISLIKHALSGAGLYDKYYGDVNSKPFCWALRLDRPRFDKGLIHLRTSEAVLIISAAEADVCIDFYKAFKATTDYSMPYNNSVHIKDVSASNPLKIRCNEIIIKMVSPLVVREHTRKDRYLDYKDKEFEKVLNENVLATLIGNQIEFEQAEIKIQPIKAYKTVTRLFGSLVNANVGVYKLSGDVKVLNAVYTLGLGARRGAGYGLFEVI